MRDRYADRIGRIYMLANHNLPKADQFAPAINMVQIHQNGEDSLLPILEEDLGAESEGSTKTITETVTKTITNTSIIPQHFPEELFMISCDSTTRDGETNSQHAAREGRNANRAKRRTEQANAAAAVTIGGGAADQQ